MLRGVHKASHGRYERRTGLVMLLAGAVSGVAFAAFITGRFEPPEAVHPAMVFVVTAGSTLLLVPAGVILWVIGAVMDRKRRP